MEEKQRELEGLKDGGAEAASDWQKDHDVDVES